MKLSLVGKTVDCTRYTRRPRTPLHPNKQIPSEKCTLPSARLQVQVLADFERQLRDFHCHQR